MPENQQEQGVVIASILPTLTNMPEILAKSQHRVARGEAAANALIAKCAEVPKMTPELDEECMNMIIKLNKTEEDMAGERKPYTQLMDEIKKTFTSLEGRFKPLREALQQKRDQRAKEVVEENKRREIEAKKIADKNKEAADLTAAMTNGITTCLNNKLFSRKQELQTLFNGLTLDDIDARGEKLRTMSNSFPAAKIEEILTFRLPAVQHHNPDEIRAIRAKVDHGYMWEPFYLQYRAELDEVVQSLVDRLPSKKADLLEAKRLADEKARLAKEKEEADARQRELDRQAREAKNAEEAKRIEDQRKREAELREQREKQEAENRKKQEEQAAADAVRKAEQARKDAEEQENRNREAAAQAEAVRVQAHGQTLFDQQLTAQVKEAAPETRKTWEITVLDPTGWGEIFQYWFINEMAATWKKKQDKVGDIDLNAMKKYCEKVAETSKIESPFLRYEEKFKAVNRQEKPNK